MLFAVLLIGIQNTFHQGWWLKCLHVYQGNNNKLGMTLCVQWVYRALSCDIS